MCFIVVFTNVMVDDRLTSKEWNLLKELCCRDFLKCFHFLLRNSGTLSLLFIDLAMETEDKKGKIPFPYSGRDTEVFYVGWAIWRSGLHWLHDQSRNIDTNSWKCHGTSNGTEVLPFSFWMPLFNDFQSMTHIDHLIPSVVLESGYVAWNHLKAQLFSLSLIILIQSFHYHGK